jgi:hypothetical protein
VGLIGCIETSVWNYLFALCINTGECRFYVMLVFCKPHGVTHRKTIIYIFCVFRTPNCTYTRGVQSPYTIELVSAISNVDSLVKWNRMEQNLMAKSVSNFSPRGGLNVWKPTVGGLNVGDSGWTDYKGR